MLRKTEIIGIRDAPTSVASMRPQRNAAENSEYGGRFTSTEVLQ